MGRYNTAVITAQGLEYIAQAISGQITLTFSRMVISDYAYPAGADLSALTSIQSVKMSVEPASVWVSGDTVGVRGLFANTSVQTAYNINTVGVFATNGTTEILFSVSTAISPDEMPVYNGVASSSFIFTVQETISEASEINITVTSAGVATAQDIADLQASKQNTISGAASTITDSNLTPSRTLASNASGKVEVSSVTTTELGRLAGVTAPIQTQLDGKQATITGAASTIAGSNLTANRVLISSASGKVAVSDTTASEIGYVHGVTSNIQTQLNAKQATVSGAASTVTGSNLTASRAVISNGSGKIAASDTTSTELGYVHGVTSSIQTQLNGKQATISGGASTIASSNLTASRALVSNSSGKVAVSAVTATELGYLDGVTSAIQTQINNKVTNSFTASRALGVNSSGKVAVATTTTTELNYLSGVTSNVQTQINNNAVTINTNSATGINGTSIPNATSSTGDTAAGSFTLAAGKWMITVAADWDDADIRKEGHRCVWLTNTQNGGFSTTTVMGSSAVSAISSGFRTRHQFTCYVQPTTSTTYYIMVRQYTTNGASVKCYTRYSTIKLHG